MLKSVLISKSKALLATVVALLALGAFAQSPSSTPANDTRSPWIQVGPEGGDVRSLAYDPSNPDHILLGTSAGQLYQSTNGGSSWARFRHLGTNDDYVLDNIAFDPKDPKTIYVAAWSVETESGDLFRSHDAGRTWQILPYTRGKSIRALALAQSDSHILVIGALDGVFRSNDGGDNWTRISPEGHAELKNIESIAVDPRNPNIVYAGTWHLPWKTEDGGKTWHNIKKGVIDDSDVFSIIIDHGNPANVFASACSGIYKSENSGELFKKVTGIPSTARRTRVLQQDPVNANVVYAGTTEGLWKTVDSGKTFTRVTPGVYIINDVMVDPRNPSRVLIATDRSGVLASNDGMKTFVTANAGFSHRQVSTIVVDAKDPATLYAGVLNDKDFGGVFVSRNSGTSWSQLSEGLAGRDVVHLMQAANRSLFAGTNHGIFRLDSAGHSWQPVNNILTEKVFPAPKPVKVKGKLVTPKARKSEWVKSELNARVTELQSAGDFLFASTANGFYISRDDGKSWTGGPIAGQSHFIGVSVCGETVAVATATALMVSTDSGKSWTTADVPSYVHRIFHVLIAPDQSIWLTSHEGALQSTDAGKSWIHVIDGLPSRNVFDVEVDRAGNRMFATVVGSGAVYESRDAGRSWHATTIAGFSLREAYAYNGRLIAATAFNGIVIQQPDPATRTTAEKIGGGGSQ